ncbi:MAG TPA: UDP-N-acetylmuramoyl-L-alanine--D-glutamate ligase [Candidatus Paceibacterota bacterium]|nr:UDP-N-acetylmuramoyl-L-alanine--D-glutamate ligase [Candidatus Paceibacterota bacterium]
MADYQAFFKGKKITLMGLGLLGRGLGDAAFLAECGAQVLVTDKKTEAELMESVAQLKKYPNITFHLGGHAIEDFTNCDLVIKAAGVPLDSPEIAAARKAGVPVAMSTALFAKFAIDAGATVVGVTGTRGKTTTAHLIFHTLQQAGKNPLLGGNVRGKSTLAMLSEVEPRNIVVLELDSWQLQGFGDLKISPQVAVFTNLMPDHQNYYKNMDEYFADKANIFRFQKPGDTLIVGKDIEQGVREAKPSTAAKVPGGIPTDWKLHIIGEHNRDNAAFAAAALEALGVSQQEIRAGLESFQAVEGRLQFVREVQSVKIYNDNNATTPEATIAALRALHVGHPMSHIVLIIGGSDKGLPLEELAAEIQNNTSHVVLLEHPNYLGTEKLGMVLKQQGVNFEKAADLQQALSLARSNTKEGDTILFSPAFASFGMFKNEYDRNDTFVRLVNEL